MPYYVARIEGMTCEHCETSVRKALDAIGVSVTDISFHRGTARLTAPSPVDIDTVRRAIESAGYRLVELTEERPDTAPGPFVHASRDVSYDLAIIGSGSAAFSAAIRARELGARVLMIESHTLGGTCVNVGCVPSKFFLRVAEVYYLARMHPYDGVPHATGPVIWSVVRTQKDDLIRQLRKEKYADLVQEYGWEVLHGRARFRDAETLEVNGTTVRAGAYLIATGASPWIPPIPGLQEAGYLTSTTLMERDALPRRIAVIGGNAIGLEMGQMLTRLGVEVTLIEILPRIAPFEEPEIGERLTEVLTAEGMRIWTASEVRRVEVRSEGKTLTVARGPEQREEVLIVDAILVATGRRPNTAGLGLEHAGIETDARGAVQVDATLRTTNPRVWAAGDVTGHPQFVYVAAYEGRIAAENALTDANHHVDLQVVPRITFTSPTIASVGLTEEAARQQGLDVESRVLPLDVVARALVDRQTHGLFKMVAETPTGRILGVHILADHAGDVIYAAQLAVQYGLRVDDLVQTLAPYLTMAEGLRLVAQAFTVDVRKMSCCAG